MNRGELLEKLKAGESLREVDLTEADPLYVDFEGADLTGADLSRTEVPPGVTGRTWPYGFAESYRAPRWRARFSGATLDRAKLDRIVGYKGDFRKASLNEASLVEADLTDADFRGADLRGADLSGAKIEGADFADAIWDDTTTWPEEAPGGCDLGRHDRLARELRTASMTRSDWPGSLRSMMFLGFAVVLVACSDPTAVPRDRPSVDGCVEWFNDQQPVGADRAVEEVFVSGQSRWEWEGRQAVCWVSLFEPECTIWSATEPTWGWTSGPVPPGDCDPVFLSVDAQHRLVDGRLASR